MESVSTFRPCQKWTPAEGAGVGRRPPIKTDRRTGAQRRRASTRNIRGEKHSVAKMKFLLNPDLWMWRESKRWVNRKLWAMLWWEKKVRESEGGRVISNQWCSLAGWAGKSDGEWGPLVSSGESRKPGTWGLGMKDSKHLDDPERGTKEHCVWGWKSLQWKNAGNACGKPYMLIFPSGSAHWFCPFAK